MENVNLREKYSKLGGSSTLWLFAEEVVAQAVSESATTNLSAVVSSEGRYVARASGAERAPRKSKQIISVESMDGAESFVRPNGDLYYGRKWGEHSDVMALRKAREMTMKSFAGEGGSPMFAMIYGAPGCGKTAMVEAAFGEDTVTLIGTGDTEVADLVGGYVQTPSGGFDWVDGGLIDAAVNGKVYFIDEIGLIDPKVLSLAYGLMDGRRELVVTANPERGTIKAHENFYVVAATNPNAPGVRLSEALLSRFTLQVEMTTDWALAKKLGVPTAIVTASQNLAKKQASNEVSWSPQMRELIAFRDVAKTFGNTFAISNLLASAPEIDRPVVTDVLTRAYGEEVKPAKI